MDHKVFQGSQGFRDSQGSPGTQVFQVSQVTQEVVFRDGAVIVEYPVIADGQANRVSAEYRDFQGIAEFQDSAVNQATADGRVNQDIQDLAEAEFPVGVGNRVYQDSQVTAEFRGTAEIAESAVFQETAVFRGGAENRVTQVLVVTAAYQDGQGIVVSQVFQGSQDTADGQEK